MLCCCSCADFHLGCLLLEGHEVQIGDVDHVRAAHHRQHPVLHLPCQGADIQQLPQLGFLSTNKTERKECVTIKCIIITERSEGSSFPFTSVPVMSCQLLI